MIGVFTIQMVAIVSKWFQGKAAVTLEELGFREEEESRFVRVNKVR